MPTATCKFCDQELSVVMSSTPKFPLHRKADSLDTCEGSWEPAADASVDYHGPAAVAEFGKIAGRRGTSVAEKIVKAHVAEAKAHERKLNPELGNSKLPSWYEEKEPEW